MHISQIFRSLVRCPIALYACVVIILLTGVKTKDKKYSLLGSCSGAIPSYDTFQDLPPVNPDKQVHHHHPHLLHRPPHHHQLPHDCSVQKYIIQDNILGEDEEDYEQNELQGRFSY